MKTYSAILVLVIGMLGSAATAEAAQRYAIEAAGNDEKFVIDGELYEAKTYCMGWDEGDEVIFVDGTPGMCVSATLFNMSRRESCDVWCE